MFRTVLASSAVVLVAAACATSLQAAHTAVTPAQAQDSYYVKGHNAVAARAVDRGARRAQERLLFIGDGMGISTITAARIYAGQRKGLDGESYQLAMEQLPYSAFSKTYTHDSQVADSAPTAGAMTTGVKSYNGTLGVTQGADIKDCASAKSNGTTSLWEIAEDQGLATGVISTARLTHATPPRPTLRPPNATGRATRTFPLRARPRAASTSRRNFSPGSPRTATASMSPLAAAVQTSCPWVRSIPIRGPDRQSRRQPQPGRGMEGGSA